MSEVEGWALEQAAEQALGLDSAGDAYGLHGGFEDPGFIETEIKVKRLAAAIAPAAAELAGAAGFGRSELWSIEFKRIKKGLETRFKGRPEVIGCFNSFAASFVNESAEFGRLAELKNGDFVGLDHSGRRARRFSRAEVLAAASISAA